MRAPFETWPASGRRQAFVAVTVVFVALLAALAWIGGQLPEGDLLDLQRADTRERVVELIEAWEAGDKIHLAGLGLGLDMAYPLSYAVFGAGLSAAAAARARRAGRSRWGDLAALAGWAVALAAVFDLVENSLQVPMLADPTAGSPGAVVAFSTAKYVLLVGALVVAVIAAWPGRRDAATGPTRD